MKQRDIIDITKPLVVNLFAGPGAGKTVMAMSLVVELKKQGIHAEYVSEVAKGCVYRLDNYRLPKEDAKAAADLISGRFYDQVELLQEQKYQLDIFAGSTQVDVVITDSPLVLSAAYLKDDDMRPVFEDMVKDEALKYHNINYFIHRNTTEFEAEGRIHTLAQSVEKDKEVKDLLNRLGQRYLIVNRENIDAVVNRIESEIGRRKSL